jgi:DNA relaxase NicK
LVTETVYQLVKKTTTAHCPKGKIDWTRGHHVKWNKPDIGQLTRVLSYMQRLKKEKCIASMRPWVLHPPQKKK